MIGVMRYIAQTPTPRRSPFKHPSIFASTDTPFSSSDYSVGDTVFIYLDWGYTVYSPTRSDTRFNPSTPTGVQELVFHGTKNGVTITLDFIEETDGQDYVNDYAVMNALNDHLARDIVAFYPDYDLLPDVFDTVIANKVNAPKRQRSIQLWSFKFDLDILPAAQAPKAIQVLNIV